MTTYEFTPGFSVDLSTVTEVVRNYQCAYVHTGDQVIKITYLPNDEACVRIPTSNASGRFITVSYENAIDFVHRAEALIPREQAGPFPMPKLKMPEPAPLQTPIAISTTIPPGWGGGSVFEKKRLARLALLEEREKEDLRAKSASVMKQITEWKSKIVDVLIRVEDENVCGEFSPGRLDFNRARSFSWLENGFYEIYCENGGKLFATPKHFDYYLPGSPYYLAMSGKWIDPFDFKRVALLVEPNCRLTVARTRA